MPFALSKKKTYGIWDERNQFIFQNIDMSENIITHKVMQSTSDYSKAWLQDKERRDKSYTKIRNQ
jgi:hypothetical protein